MLVEVIHAIENSFSFSITAKKIFFRCYLRSAVCMFVCVFVSLFVSLFVHTITDKLFNTELSNLLQKIRLVNS